MDKKRGDNMIEIICRENQQETQEIKLPKNIRQVGSPKGRHKIYIEDYVYTYLKKSGKGKSEECGSIIGEKQCQPGYPLYFRLWSSGMWTGNISV